MTLEGVDSRDYGVLTLSSRESVILCEIARLDGSGLPPFGVELLGEVRDHVEISEGHLFDLCGELSDRGLIEFHRDGNAKRYTLTDEGWQVLAAGRDLLTDVLEDIDE